MTGMSRRHLLRTASLSALGLALSTAVTPGAAARPEGPTWNLAPRSAALRALDPATSQYEPVLPLSITATHSLSSDAFVSTELQLDFTGDNPDQLVPITRSHGRVEALILSGRENLLYLLYRDASAAGGWQRDVVYPPAGSDLPYRLTEFTAAFDPTDGNVHLVIREQDGTWGDWISVFYMGEDNVVQGSNMIKYWANNSSNGGWWGYASSHAQPRYFLDGVNVPTFYLWDDPGTYYTIDRQVAPGTQPTVTLTPNTLAGFPSTTVADGRILGYGDRAFVALTVDGSGGGFECPFGGVVSVGPLPAGASIEWAGVIPTEQTPSPAFLSADADGATLTYFQFSSDSLLPQRDQLLQLPDGATLASVASSNNQAASQLYFVLDGPDSVAGQLWTMVSGLADGVPNFAPIPVDTGYSAIYAPDLLTDDVTLFAILDDGMTVRILSRSAGSASSFYSQPLNGVSAPDNPADGPWTAVPVHLAATTASQVDTWRTSIRVTDAFGAVQVGVPVTVAVDRDVTVWQPGGTGLNGQPLDTVTTISATGSPATFFTDIDGEVTLAVPASVLHTASYSVTTGEEPSVILAPDADIHARLADLSSLPAALQYATAADGSPLFGALQPAPDDGISAGDAAVQAATLIAQVMNVGLGTAPTDLSTPLALGGLRSADSLSLTSGPAVQRAAVGSLRSFWDAAKHDAESVVRAVETAAITVADDAEQAAQLVKDAATGVWQITLNLAGDFDDAVSWAVSDARSAVTAVTGIFHALLHDAEKGLHDILHWLKDDVLGLLRDAADAAAALAGLVTGSDASTQLKAVVDRWRTTVDGDFDDLRDEVKTTFSAVQTFLSGQSVNTMRAGVTAPAGSAGVQAMAVSDPSRLQELADVVHDVRGQWLRDKLKHQATRAPAVADEVGPALLQLITDLGNDIEGLLGSFGAVASDTVGLSADGSQAGVSDGGLGGIFNHVGTFIDEVFAVVDKLIDDLLDVLLAIWDNIVAVLSQTLDQVFPAAAPIMDLIGLENVTVAQLLAMFITLPGTLFARVRFGGDATMFSTSASATSGALDADAQDWGSFLATASLLGTFFWGVLDGSVDVLRLAAQADGQTYDPPTFVAWTDLGFSFFANLVSYPFSSTQPLSWVPTTWTGKYPNLPVGVWAAGFAPAAVSFAGTWAATHFDNQDIKDGIGLVQTFTVSGIGVALTALDSTVAWRGAPSSDAAASKTIAVTGNLTNVMSPLGLLAGNTVAFSDIVKVVFDIACPIICFGSGLALLETAG
ncbi:hypothetical protein FDO65_11970 [Nakamurella flava]|uniref:Uncharacterized protein n=1 Tax=Nakamurella flava TaxID=2576308 RepID=A0A4U6QE27_9ACTN|nr:hypothetical protein [Nakamurella flava]TKV58298.1 hypothetical protein FDO65_11970 [Nakamurella flava]